MGDDRLQKVKEKPVLDGRIPHPYREYLQGLQAIVAKLEEISAKLPIAIPTVTPGIRPGMPAVKVPVPVLQLSKEQFIDVYATALEKQGVLKFADDLHVQDIDLGVDRTTDTEIEELPKCKNSIALTVLLNTGTFDLYINEKNVDHKIPIAALTWPQTLLIDWFRIQTIYVGNTVQTGLSATLIAWKRLS